MSAPSGEGLSKGAKRRAAQKRAKEEADAAEAAAAPPAAPKAKAKAKVAAAPAPVKEAAPAAPPAPVAVAKSKAKAKASPAPVVVAEPAVAEPTPKAKSKKKKATAEEPEALLQNTDAKKVEEMTPYLIDDGTGGGWEECAGTSKKNQRRKEAKAAEEARIAAMYGRSHMSGKVLAANEHVVGLEYADAKPTSGTQAVLSKMAALKEAQEKGGQALEKPQGPPVSSVLIEVPEKRIGVVIGPKGANIKAIQEKSGGAKIDVNGNTFTVTGPGSSVLTAQTAIRDLIEKGYTALAFDDDFQENFVMIHGSSLADVVGKEGVVIRKIKEALGVEVTLPSVPRPAVVMSKKYKVGLAGAVDKVEKAHQVLTNIATYYHDDLTHPDEIHAEIEVAAWQYAYIIGTKGSEMKHIQKNFKVSVHIPREYNYCQNVVVVGAKDDVVRASTYIEKLLWNASNVAKGRDRGEGAVDDGDEQHEAWMDQYMYKR